MRNIILIIIALVFISGCVQVEEGKTFTLSGLTADKVLVTEAVPKYETGDKVTNYATAFETKTINVENGKATITLGESPVFIELSSAYTKASLADYEDSPFGFHYSRELENHALDLGIRWIRVNAVWILVQPKETNVKESVFDWQALEENWKYNQYANKNVNFMVTISQLGITKDSYIPHSGLYNEDSYTKFVKALVERYDGDGYNDAPNLITPIKYWQVENEPKPFLKDFSKLQKLTYRAVKEVCGDCKILIGGAGYGQGLLTEFDRVIFPILKELNGNYVDIFDFHWFGTAQQYNPQELFEHIKKRLKDANFGDIPFWITEMGTYSGDPKELRPEQNFPYQSEQEQAQSLIKRYVSSLSQEIEKIFWAWGIKEGFKRDQGFFDFTGLIYDGEFSYDKGEGVKKLSYHTYKLMTEKLEGSDWSNVETIIDGKDNIYVYKFTRKDLNKPIYVAWYDFFEEEEKIEEKKPAEKEKLEEKPEKKAKGKCGDGVCGPVEEANPSLCPEDCK